jgi:hypothetical protein
MTTKKIATVCMTSDPCIAFHNGAFQPHDCLIADENVVWVWEPINGHYTTRHNMPPVFQRRMIVAAAVAAGCATTIAAIEKARAEAAVSDAACYAAQDEAERYDEQELARRSNGRIY